MNINRPGKNVHFPASWAKFPSRGADFPPVWDGFPYVFLYFFPPNHKISRQGASRFAYFFHAWLYKKKMSTLLQCKVWCVQSNNNFVIHFCLCIKENSINEFRRLRLDIGYSFGYYLLSSWTYPNENLRLGSLIWRKKMMLKLKFTLSQCLDTLIHHGTSKSFLLMLHFTP